MISVGSLLGKIFFHEEREEHLGTLCLFLCQRKEILFEDVMSGAMFAILWPWAFRETENADIVELRKPVCDGPASDLSVSQNRSLL